jgi:hypothetical protein
MPSIPPVVGLWVCDEPAVAYERASEKHRQARHLRRHEAAPARQQGAPDPGHCDPTLNLYDWYVYIRNNRVEQLRPITTRSAVY